MNNPIVYWHIVAGLKDGSTIILDEPEGYPPEVNEAVNKYIENNHDYDWEAEHN